MAENFANEYATTLVNGVDNDDPSIVVESATDSPDANFRVKIDSEYLLVTEKAGTTFTVTRGIEGSAPSAHGAGAAVTHVLTAGGLDQALAEVGSADITEVLTRSGSAFVPSQSVDFYRHVWFDSLAAQHTLHYTLSGSAVLPTVALPSDISVTATYVPS